MRNMTNNCGHQITIPDNCYWRHKKVTLPKDETLIERLCNPKTAGSLKDQEFFYQPRHVRRHNIFDTGLASLRRLPIFRAVGGRLPAPRQKRKVTRVRRPQCDPLVLPDRRTYTERNLGNSVGIELYGYPSPFLVLTPSQQISRTSMARAH